MRVDLGWTPRAWQARLLAARRRFNVWVCHRQSGKTEAAKMLLVDAALRTTAALARYGYVAPTRVQAKSVLWDRLRATVRRVPGVVIAESELSVRFPHNGAVIRLYGADDPDALRGHTFAGIVIDEVSDHSRRVWGEILLPTLTAHRGWAVFVGTPRGLNLLSDLYYGHQHDREWHVEKVGIHSSGVLTAAEIAALQGQCTPSQFAQEFACDFNASSDFLTIDALTAVTVFGRAELPPQADVDYNAFTDLASGSGDDDATLAIGHKESREGATVCVLDLVRVMRPPFAVDAVVQEFATICRGYEVQRVVGDRFGTTFAESMMFDAGLTLWPAEQTKSELYVELVPVVNAKRVELLDLPSLRTQLAGLRRRVGRSGRVYVDHASGDHDDVANAVAGVVFEVLQPRSRAFGIGRAITADDPGDAAGLDATARPSWIDFFQRGATWTEPTAPPTRSNIGRATTFDNSGRGPWEER